MKFAFVFFCLFSTFLKDVSAAPTCPQVQTMRTAVITATQNQKGLLPLLVRLGFHDCVGGCNGCINFNNPDNNGLAPAVATLNQTYTANNFKSFGVSLADFFAFAATVGVTAAVQNSNKERNGGQSCTPKSCPGPCPVPCFPLKWGRVDATDCSTSEPGLPSPTMTGAAMFTYFQSEFKFTPAQVVALMGVHSLGGANPNNSGYAGKWIGANAGLNELYYLNMINATNKWTNVNAAPRNSPNPKWQFNGQLADGSKAGFMLNTDFELFYDLTLDPLTAQATCALNPVCGLSTPNSCGSGCQVASTFNQAYNYSQNCTAFMGDFVSVFQQMLTNKNTNLQSTTCCP